MAKCLTTKTVALPKGEGNHIASAVSEVTQ